LCRGRRRRSMLAKEQIKEEGRWVIRQRKKKKN
jgi:hypothetical protein